MERLTAPTTTHQASLAHPKYTLTLAGCAGFTSHAAAGKPGTNVPLQFLQWTFVSSPQNPLLHFVLRRVTTAISAIPFVADDKATLERTGPKVFSRAILDFIGEFGSTPGMFDYGNHKYPLALIPANELEQSGQVLELKGIYRGKPFELRGLVLPVRAFG